MLSIQSKRCLSSRLTPEKYYTEPRIKIKNTRFQQQLCKRDNPKNVSATSVVSMGKVHNAEDRGNLKKKQPQPQPQPQPPIDQKKKMTGQFIEFPQSKRQSTFPSTFTKEAPTSLADTMIYERMPRLVELSKPRYIQQPFLKDLSYHIPKKVLNAEASQRIIELSQPRRIYTEPEDTKMFKRVKSRSKSTISRLMDNQSKKKMGSDRHVNESKLKGKQKQKPSSVKCFGSNDSVIDAVGKRNIFRSTKFFKKTFKKEKNKSKLEKRPIFK